MNQSRTNVDGRLSALEARVESVVGSLGEVVAVVRGLGDKLDTRGRTPWGVIWSAIGVGVTFVGAIGGLAYYPINTGMSDLKGSLLLIQDRADKRIEQLAANQVTRAEHEVHWRAQDRDYDFMRDRIGRVETRAVKGIDELKASVERLEDRVVARTELTGRFEAQERAIATLRAEHEEHIRAFNDRQQRRIDTLEAVPRK